MAAGAGGPFIGLSRNVRKRDAAMELLRSFLSGGRTLTVPNEWDAVIRQMTPEVRNSSPRENLKKSLGKTAASLEKLGLVHIDRGVGTARVIRFTKEGEAYQPREDAPVRQQKKPAETKQMVVQRVARKLSKRPTLEEVVAYVEGNAQVQLALQIRERQRELEQQRAAIEHALTPEELLVCDMMDASLDDFRDTAMVLAPILKILQHK